ncbi:MAG: hypothetical protein QOI67_1404 [Gaiellaceae bacterium]|nr:hypothetical protein [Gaiellaceae bacterium]
MLVASSLLAFVIGAAFAVLIVTILDLRDSNRDSRRSQEVIVAANRLERLVVDLETGQRGFLVTSEERFLEPWAAARLALPDASSEFNRLAAASVEDGLSRRITEAIAAYVREYSVPLVAAARRGDPAAKSVAETDRGKRLVDVIRNQFDEFLAAERNLSAQRQERTDAATQRAIVAATAGLAASMLLIVLYAGYVTQAIVRPVRRAALLADRIAAGDLGTRMAESGTAEIGALEHSFNVMADSLERDRSEVTRLAEEQAALRRVATLVAQGAPPHEVFPAVAQEVGQLLPVDYAMMSRFESDGTVTIVGGWSRTGDELPVGTRWALGGKNLSTLVAETGRSARMDSYAETSSGALGELIRAGGLRAGVGTPIIVEGAAWGVMIAASTAEDRQPSETEARLAEFTELVGMAIANAESRADLTASRARIVATADDTRRRIERDLHDGAQQRLVTLALELRAAQTAVPSPLAELNDELSRVAEGLVSVLDDLRETARGIHPAILAEGGIGPALKTLARRSPIPVEVDVQSDARLPESVEVATYYVVSEALTNAAKHANASVVRVGVEAVDGVLRVTIRDDGSGGADATRGSGLVGLKDRAEALGGTLSVQSRPGDGTTIRVELPLDE